MSIRAGLHRSAHEGISMLEFNRLYLMDCMDGMREFPDKYFDLAIVDPPYGINRFKNGQPTRLNKYGSLAAANDAKPTPAYFAELFRISREQIVWGYNHLSDMLPPTTEFIFWYKHQPVNSYSDGELAWTSFPKTARCFDYPFFGVTGKDSLRIHPTQKPVALYRWLFKNYAKPGDKILDTHAGSASSFIAAYELGFDYVGFELDPDYHAAASQRVAAAMAQGRLFEPANDNSYKQQPLF